MKQDIHNQYHSITVLKL